MANDVFLKQVSQKAKEYKELNAYFEKNKTSFSRTDGGNEWQAIEALKDYVQYGDFDAAKDASLLQANLNKPFAKFHKEGTDQGDNFREFVRLCKSYLFTDKEVFEAFQKELGGKKRKQQEQKQEQKQQQKEQKQELKQEQKQEQQQGNAVFLKMVPQKAKEWKELIAYFQKRKDSFSHTDAGQNEWLAIEMLQDYLYCEDFDAAKITTLLQENLSRPFMKWHKDGTDDGERFREFIRLCKQYLFTEKEIFVAFQKEFGGKQKKQKKQEEHKQQQQEQEKKKKGGSIFLQLEDGYYSGLVDEQGRFHGYGERHWNKGDWYKGNFSHGITKGEGTYYNKGNDRTDTGIWDNFSGVGEMVVEWGGGNRYEGTWKNDNKGYMEGEGVFYYIDGSVEKGYFSDGNWHKTKTIKGSDYGNSGGGGGSYTPKSSVNWTQILMWIAAGITVVAAVWTWLSSGFWSAIGTAFTGAIACGLLWIFLRTVKWLWENKWALILLIIGFLTYLSYNSYNKPDGWLHKMFNNKDNTEQVDKQETYLTGTITSNSVNMRAKPNGKVIKALKKGDKLHVTGDVVGGWLPVESNGTKGYVSADYVKIDRNAGQTSKSETKTETTASSAISPERIAAIKVANPENSFKGFTATITSVAMQGKNLVVKFTFQNNTGFVWDCGLNNEWMNGYSEAVDNEGTKCEVVYVSPDSDHKLKLSPSMKSKGEVRITGFDPAATDFAELRIKMYGSSGGESGDSFHGYTTDVLILRNVPIK